MKHTVIVFLLASCGAQKLKVEPVKVEPIHMTIDVNLHDRSDDAGRPAKP